VSGADTGGDWPSQSESSKGVTDLLQVLNVGWDHRWAAGSLRCLLCSSVCMCTACTHGVWQGGLQQGHDQPI
jgi:hypothetical protein